MSINIASMVNGYTDCAVWTDCGPDSDIPEGAGFSAEALNKLNADCAAFIAACGEPLLDALAELAPEYGDERFGHDFWLTRNGHGAGYWDRSELESKLGHASVSLGDDAGRAGLTLGELLTQRATAQGTCDLYLGDDGLVYAY